MTRQPGKPTSTPDEATATPSTDASPTTPEATAATSKPRASRRRLYAPDPASGPADTAPTTPVTVPDTTTNGSIESVAPVATVARTESSKIAGADAASDGAARNPAPPQAARKAAGPAPLPAPRPITRSPMLRRLRAKQTIRDHVLLAAGAMAIPVPFVDMAAEAAVQIRMIRRLAVIHGVDFAEERAKALVAAALGGFSAGWAASSLLRYASFAMYFANFWPSAAIASAITWGIGKLFDQHFEHGGGLHDMKPETVASTLRERAVELRARLGGRTPRPPAARTP